MSIRLLWSLSVSLLLCASLVQAEPSHWVDLQKLSTSTKKKLLRSKMSEYTSTQQFALSCGDDFSTTDFHKHRIEFEVDQPLVDVWNAYLSADPRSSWTTKDIKFDFAYSKQTEKLYYRDDKMPSLHLGMGFFIVLHIFPLVNIAAAMEITNLDEETHTIAYTYLQKNTSHGKQILRFVAQGPHKTKIEHTTYFKSQSRLRDRFYPRIHEDLVTQFHRAVLKSLGASLHVLP